jgi:hypothetical protein
MTVELHSADVPQEDNLTDVRRTVEAIGSGLEDTQGIAERTRRSRRHAGYAVNAAIVLGWVEAGDALVPTELGRKLLAAPEGSEAERAAFREAIEKSPSVSAIAPALLGTEPPDRVAIAARITQLAGLAASTAGRRAQTLLSWRRQVLGQ